MPKANTWSASHRKNTIFCENRQFNNCFIIVLLSLLSLSYLAFHAMTFECSAKRAAIVYQIESKAQAQSIICSSAMFLTNAHAQSVICMQLLHVKWPIRIKNTYKENDINNCHYKTWRFRANSTTEINVKQSV